MLSFHAEHEVMSCFGFGSGIYNIYIDVLIILNVDMGHKSKHLYSSLSNMVQFRLK